MAEWTQANFGEARDVLRADAAGMPEPQRRQMVAALSEAAVSGIADPAVRELVELLAHDPVWEVRIEVARMVHLLDDELCSRLVALFRTDANRFVRSIAERSLSRQRKAHQATSRRRGKCRTYADQLDQLTRQYGKRAAARVESLADQRYMMLASAVAHDVRSILTTLSTNATALANGAGGRVGSILEDISLLKHTIEAMEQFAKPVPVERHPEDLREVIRQAIDKAREGVMQQGHDIAAVEVVMAAVPAIQLRVARRLIVLALTNVIQNAIESFADRDQDALRSGRVEVQVIVDGYDTRILVRDDGPGIEPEVLRELRAFAPTGKNKTKRNSSGWGLSLVHKYISAHGGTVAIESEVDQGTTVVLTLPMREPAGGEEE